MTGRLLFVCLTALLAAGARAADPDLILHNGKIVTVDKKFTIQQGHRRLQGNRIVQVGSNDDVLKTKGNATRSSRPRRARWSCPASSTRTCIPTGACMIEFDHPIPEMESISDVLDYIKGAGQGAGRGRVDRRQPGLHHAAQGTALPDARRTGRGGAEEPGRLRHRTGRVAQHAGPEDEQDRQGLQDHRRRRRLREKDPTTGEPTGILRSCTRVRQSQAAAAARPPKRTASSGCCELFKDYNSVGLTGDRRPRRRERRPSSRYRQAARAGRSCRCASRCRNTSARVGDIDDIQKNIRKIAARPAEPRPTPGCASSASRPISTAACSPAAPTCASPGA